jgi:hypothetical protein
MESIAFRYKVIAAPSTFKKQSWFHSAEMYPLQLLASASTPIFIATCAAVSRAASWPYPPFETDGRWIIDAAGHTITYAGINWPGAADTMLPEGLQYSSVAEIVSKIKSTGMNVIRLTYAIEMIDDFYSSGDIPILTSFINALGESNGTAIFDAVIKNNPQFTSQTTRMEVRINQH